MGTTVWMKATMLLTTQHPFSRGGKNGTKRWRKIKNVLQLTAVSVLVREVAPLSLPFQGVYSAEQRSGTPLCSPPLMFAIPWCKAQGPDSTFPSHWPIAKGYVCFGAPVIRQRGFEAKAPACEQPLTNAQNTRSAQWSEKVYVCVDIHIGLK